VDVTTPGTRDLSTKKQRPGGMDCPICYEPLTKGKTLKTTCKHVFHRKCIKGWYKTRHNSCPMCRAAPEPPKPEHAMCIDPTCTESPKDEWSVMCAHHLEMCMFRYGVVVCN